MTADTNGLVRGIDSAGNKLQSFNARAQATGKSVGALSNNFEKLSRTIKAAGAAAIAIRELGGGDGGTEVSRVTDKIQNLAQTAAIFGGPKVRAAALSVMVLGEGVKFLDRQFNDLSDSEKEALKRQQELTKAREAQQKSIDGLIGGLKTELETFGMSARQLDEYKLKQAGATEADKQRAAVILDQIDALKRQEEAAEKAAKAEEERAKEALKNIEEIAQRRQDAEEETNRFLQEREEMLRRSNETGDIESPRIAAFGSQDAVQRINEIIGEPRQKLDKEQLDEMKRQTRELAEIRRRLGIPDNQLQEAVF